MPDIEQSAVEVPEREPGGSGSDRRLEDRRTDYPRDFPEPPAARADSEFIWDEGKLPAENYGALGRVLAETKDFYRRPVHGGGLLLAPEHANAPPVALDDPTRFLAAILDHVRVAVVKGEKSKGGLIPTAHLRAMTHSELFLRELPAIDEVVDHVLYLGPDFQPTIPGYNDRGFGRRVLHVGLPSRVSTRREALDAFFGVMHFESTADLANAYAAGLTIRLRNHWPGGKPIVIVSATKSHAGKETLIAGVAGATPLIAVSYEEADWAFARSVIAASQQDPKIGIINVDNARLGRARLIRSAFLERILTDPEPFFFSTGTGRPVRRKNSLVFTMSTNEGTVSPDLMNRGLPIRLAPTGDVMRRRSPIGNPKLEYLPRHRDQIDAEFHGMIENWRQAGCPLDTEISHPFTPWARTVGGILIANGIGGFLGNIDVRRSVDDPARRALGLLGASAPGEWLTASDWAAKVVDLGLVRALISEADRASAKARARGTGVTLSAHLDETLDASTECHAFRLTIERARRRFDGATEAQTRYRFRIVDRNDIPTDAEHPV